MLHKNLKSSHHTLIVQCLDLSSLLWTSLSYSMVQCRVQCINFKSWQRCRVKLIFHHHKLTFGPGTVTFCFSFSLISEWPANVTILICGNKLPESEGLLIWSADNESLPRGFDGLWRRGEHDPLIREGGGEWEKSGTWDTVLDSSGNSSRWTETPKILRFLHAQAAGS